MDGANRQFILGKEAWLANSLLLYKVNSKSVAGQAVAQCSLTKGNIHQELSIVNFDLRKEGNFINSGQKAKQYLLTGLDDEVNSKGKARKVGNKTNVISAYFLPWGAGRTYSGQLGINADFFFTPTLNGCTFAYDGAGPNPSVAHSNFVDDDTQKVDQTLIDNDLSTVFGGAMPANILRKADYKLAIPASSEIADYKTMIIGIRNGNSWNFYQQHFSANVSKATLFRKSKQYYAGYGLCNPI